MLSTSRDTSPFRYERSCSRNELSTLCVGWEEGEDIGKRRKEEGRGGKRREEEGKDIGKRREEEGEDIGKGRKEEGRGGKRREKT